MDTRIKAIATASMYDMTAVGRGAMDKETLRATKENLSKQRWVEYYLEEVSNFFSRCRIILKRTE